MATNTQGLAVEIWSDVVCPWCWIGATRFARALSGFEHRDRVAVTHHAYRLMPGMAPRPVEEIVAAKMGLPASQAGAVFRQVEEAAAGEGLEYHLAGTLTGDTLDAHRLIKLAAQEGRANAMLLRLYRAYLSEKVSVFDHASLLALAAETGIDRDRAQAVLKGDAFGAEVERDQLTLQRLGGNGVPFFLIGGKYAVSGAQSPEVFAQALEKAWADMPARPEVLADGAVCGPDGCAI
ncbi:DsbA family oxidoreductase [Paenirhodobacter populi]|uniref:DsbA family oxidoreductase n=1 Tax=Paenirhodobacter populi TaxID=2306993 RepID=A0A443JGI7_9RHOB|nr:DsbA family oxidoreductase [Sinirhodobacter populi]RWR19513.1 DsbA family oxidoreductase [Sinirhodobacter populi]